MNENQPTPEQKRVTAALRKIKHRTNSTPEALAATGLTDAELVFFMREKYRESVELTHDPESDTYAREMGRYALSGDAMFGADRNQLNAEARRLGYKTDGDAVDWILRVVSEGAQYYQSMYEANSTENVDPAPTPDYDLPVEATEQDSVDTEVEVESAPLPIIGLDDTIREMFHRDRVQMQMFKAQSLLVAFGKARSPKPDRAVKETIAISLEDVVARSHASKEKTELLQRFCGVYLGKLTYDGSYDIYSGEFDKFVSEVRESLYEDIADDGEARSVIESDIAHQLMKLYSTKK